MGTFSSFWEENGGESSMSQSTAAVLLCVLHARRGVGEDRGAVRAI